MTNWFYNEVEMFDKHRMLTNAGANHRRSMLVQKGQPGFVRRGALFLGRHLVDAGRGLLDRYEPIPTNEGFPQPTSVD